MEWEAGLGLQFAHHYISAATIIDHVAGFFRLSPFERKRLTPPNEKGPQHCRGPFVPRNGFEPSHPCERCDLNTVRLPISPPGQEGKF